MLAEAFVSPAGPLGSAITIAGWVLWVIFVVEFLARLVIAPSKTTFLKRNWWQAVFLIFPFLRLFRLLRVAKVARLARVGRLASSTVRAGRSAGRVLTGRVGWLAGVTLVVVLAGGQALFEFGGYDSYGRALFEAAMAAISGNSLEGDSSVAQVLSVMLAIYSVVVFASLAATLGAYFMRGAKDSDVEQNG